MDFGRAAEVTGAEAVRHNVCTTYLALGKCAPGAVLDLSEERWLVTSPFPHPIANFAERLHLSQGGFDEIVERARASLNFRAYALTGDTPTDVGKRFAAAGLVERYTLTGMEHKGVALPVEALLVRSENEVALKQTAKFMVDTFFWRSPRAVRLPLAQILVASASLGHEHYLFCDDAGPAAAATLAIADGIGGLYNLCVRPDARARGLGAHCALQIAAEAHRRELSLVLQCDASLVAWYKRLNFQSVSKLSAYSS